MIITQCLPFKRCAVVDMRDTARAPAVLRAACERYGFFYLANHGVPQALIDEVRVDPIQ